ncbi:Sec-independent protein translocase subunit TatA [Undibacterium sp. JH2W]|uniref:Sec-independent protein translocase subunit TatA n=1 Tax=Undibacterium sp. JH2W TaxID=3413037 RepID=UPI003BF2FFF2
MGSLSIWHWLIVLVVVIVVFGTKKLSNVGTDASKIVRDFKEGMKDRDEKPVASQQVADKTPIDVDAKEKSKL